MKKILSLLLVSVMLCGMLFTLASCDEPKDAGAEISVYLGQDVFDFDPSDYYVDDNAEQLLSLLYEPLFKLDAKGNLINGVASEYEVNESKRQIVITLRETYWSDEQPVTADNFVYAWSQVLLNPQKPNPAAALLYDIENAVAVKQGDITYSDLKAVATASNEITITYRLGADYKQLLKNLASIATSPIRQEIVDKDPLAWSKDLSSLTTNGPFKVSLLNRVFNTETKSLEENTFVLERNMGYHQHSSAENYTQHVTPASLINFTTVDGAVSLTYDDLLEKVVFYLADAPLSDRMDNADYATVADDMSTYTYVFNTQKGIFKDANVRRALSLAIDREAIVEAVTFGKVATGFLTDGVASSIYNASNNVRFTSDLAKAQDLIEAAELSEEDMSFTLSVNNDEESIAIAEIAVLCWAELGFDVTIKTLGIVQNSVRDPNSDKDNKFILDSELQSVMKEASFGKRDFDVIAVDWQMYSNDPFVALAAFSTSLNGNGTDYTVNSLGIHRGNVPGWADKNYDSLLLAAFDATNPETRAAALREAEKILLESCPIIPIMFNQNFTFLSSEVSNVTVDGFGNFVLNKIYQKNYHLYLPVEDLPEEDDSEDDYYEDDEYFEED